MDTLTIRPGYGLGSLAFGLSPRDAKRLLGEPSRVLDDREDPGSELWLYDEYGAALGFDRECDHRLASFEILNPAAVLENVRLIGQTEEQAAVTLRGKYAFPIQAMLHEDETLEQLRIPDLNLSVWIESGHVASISWSVLNGENGEPLWPEAAAN